MIQASDFCVFYFNNEYLPASRKESKKAITSYQPKSGTGVAFDYAKAHKFFVKIIYCATSSK